MIKRIVTTTLLCLIVTTTAWAVTLDSLVLNTVTFGSKPVLIPLGDSITEGYLSTEYWGYRKKLQILQGVSMRFEGAFTNNMSSEFYSVYHSGVSGETTDEIEARVQGELDTFFPTLGKGVFLIHAGTNDLAASGQEQIATDNVEDMIDLIDAHNSDIDIYVALIIPNRDSTRNNRIITYNGLLLTMLQGYSKSNLYIVDINSAFLNDTFGVCSGDWANNCMIDDTHPNDTGYEGVIARQWYECLTWRKGVNCNGY